MGQRSLLKRPNPAMGADCSPAYDIVSMTTILSSDAGRAF
jgi:hypothetical protein